MHDCKNLKEYKLCKKYYTWNHVTCSSKNDKFLASIIDDSLITCDEIIDITKTVSTNFNEKKIASKTKKLCILLTFFIN